eukprot:gnl/TRDRNA2_/TRDRNA2_177579_c1_seq34.p1 gnl/TRDRNA2_/TRDRNA2_177579_c1~~gnl/TRDRNA2_/TRDRNA2_177579_c1_seq34.p1  ORF type:complete len:793 (+),score=115.26 gnl/TRDRNA2_/TRDRNA2_177579_c1_seq34:108-2486(+)
MREVTVDVPETSRSTYQKLRDATPPPQGRSRSSLVGDASPAQVSVVQFAQPIFFALEGTDTELSIDVMRLGKLDDAVSVSYHTADASAKAGSKYEAVEGELHFEPGETQKSLLVRIIDDDHFTTTVDFRVNLVHPKQCKLGNYLHTCRVKIIDDDIFPSNRFKEQIQSENFEEIPGVLLMLEFFKFSLNVPGVRWRTLLKISLAQLHNLYYLLTTYLSLYVVDVFFNDEEVEKLLVKDSHSKTAMVIAALYIVPFALLHLVDIMSLRLEVAGQLQKQLQEDLFRKYLHYNEESREKVPQSDLALIIVKSTNEVAEGGFMKGMHMFRVCGKIAVVACFVYKESPDALWFIFCFPIIVGIWVATRIPVFTALGGALIEKEHAAAKEVHNASAVFRLIADYSKRGKITQAFTKFVDEIMESKLPLQLASLNSSYFIKWTSTLLLAAYIVIFSQHVIAKQLSLGTFLATMRIIAELGNEFREIYAEAEEIVRSIGPLFEVTKLINGQTDVNQRREASLKKSKRMHTEMARIQSETSQSIQAQGDRGITDPENSAVSQLFEVDHILLSITDLRFHYGGPQSRCVVNIPNLSVPQGSLVAIVGTHGSGKSTLMQLLGEVLEPQEGEIFLPPHLRTLHVSRAPILVDDTLFANLTFGGEEKPDRVRRILQRLELREADRIVQKELDAEDDGCEDPRWQHKLTMSDMSLVHLARAFVFNPNILVVHKPTSPFNHAKANLVMQLLEEFCTLSGIEVDSEQAYRRPRTLFYSSDMPADEQDRAKLIWEINVGGVVEEVRSIL